jgi:hypothetical protein
MILLRIVLLIGCIAWVAFWLAVVVGRFDADPWAAGAGLVVFFAWLLARRHTR